MTIFNYKGHPRETMKPMQTFLHCIANPAGFTRCLFPVDHALLSGRKEFNYKPHGNPVLSFIRTQILHYPGVFNVGGSVVELGHTNLIGWPVLSVVLHGEVVRGL